ncbi:ATP-binding mismatch repair protein [Coemansia nantahalensis]|uniref:ATP-binding mismatch repair protein n=1 Tax=Coemansia nantahalensis TaxID=2789366 RepID=A0ACC1JR43_9FUNG|nr:ATP-binding mismatch repair protein [Coemansia nantahalensis]
MHPIAKDTVQRLCAGQVVVDLATSVKELVENSLDAGATHIDIKLRDSGLGSITVADNGQGIDAAGFAALCRRHWTSKIQRFEDLDGVSTFGFRGEALSSLCTVATVTVTTATRESAPAGTQLTFTGDGELAGQTAVARERGTTVVVEGLFAKWPVRLQDLRKNVRREYLRLVALVEQYAIISDGVRLSLANQTRGGASTVAVRTLAQADRLARVVAVCGAAVRAHLVPVAHQADAAADGCPAMAIAGHVSRPLPDAGRAAADKQYFFVNGRPCDFPRAKRLVNELYRAHCPTRFPVFAIAITVDAASIDVNLTPDKRTILVRHEARLLDALRAALAHAFAPDESVFSVSRVQTQLLPAAVAAEEPAAVAAEPALPALPAPALTSVPGVVRCPGDWPSNSAGPKAPAEAGEEPPRPAARGPSGRKQGTLLPPVAEAAEAMDAEAMDVEERPAARPAPPPKRVRVPGPPREAAADGCPRQTGGRLAAMVIGVCRGRQKDDAHDWGAVAARLRAKRAREARRAEESQQRAEPDAELEQGGIDNASDPAAASSALSRLIHKRDFGAMGVVGQFNRGFIIARLGADLYIVDQHASDEKYNFEQLQQSATIASQPLIRPAVLELSVVDECVAIEHRPALEQNGFHLRIDEAADPGRRIALLSQPFIDQTLFTQQDLLELIGRLAASPESTPRCDRARRMFASRACRKSIMIGDALTPAQMRAVVHHLSELDHPWNCPHGRPTMRHLYRMPA